MSSHTSRNSSFGGYLALGLCLCLGLIALGLLLGRAAVQVKRFERTVTVKGLAEREVPADIALWPIQFTAADNDLAALYAALERDTDKVADFLAAAGFTTGEITISPPAVVDKLAQQYGGNGNVPFRYTANRTVTVYTPRVEAARVTQQQLAELGREGIVFSGEGYQTQTQYLFMGLNDIKPSMVEDATRNARQVAEKFAQDSDSRLGKIKSARQGQFSIDDRDRNNPHIKKVRVVSTVVYYLSD